MQSKMHLLGWVLIATLALTACGGRQPAAGSEATAAVSATEPADAAAPAADTTQPTEATEPTEAAAEVEAGPTEETPLEVSDRTAGLDQLSSYRLAWSATWEGEEDGETREFNWEWTQEVTTAPPAQHLAFSGSGTGETGSGTFETYRIGDTQYIVSVNADGERNCMSMTSDDTDERTDAFNPSVLGSLNDARFTGTETVNGIAARRYTYDEKSMNLFGSGKVTGQVWVAVEGGFVVKETVQWEGGAAGFMGLSGGTGKGQWTWEVRDANAPFTIEPPAGCESAGGDLPIMADATEKTTMGGMLMYKTAAAPAEVAEFYQAEMKAAGWTLDGEPSSIEGLIQLSFKKDGSTAQLMITSDDEGTQVIVNVGKE